MTPQQLEIINSFREFCIRRLQKQRNAKTTVLLTEQNEECRKALMEEISLLESYISTSVKSTALAALGMKIG